MSQILNSLNPRFRLNQEAQNNVKVWNQKYISILKTCQGKKT
jgi:hypothetical protein